jgi:hypothetical protein
MNIEGTNSQQPLCSVAIDTQMTNANSTRCRFRFSLRSAFAIITSICLSLILFRADLGPFATLSLSPLTWLFCGFIVSLDLCRTPHDLTFTARHAIVILAFGLFLPLAILIAMSVVFSIVATP